MKTLVRHSLDEEFTSKFGIDEILDFFEGTQKKVFVVRIGEEKQVIKFFKNFGKRDIREHAIYDKFREVEGLPKVIDIVEFNDEKIVFEEYIDGDTLEIVKGNYTHNSESIIDLMRNIIQILIPLWSSGIIHRDLAPKNIIIDKLGKPFVIDFGIARDLNASSLTEMGFQPNTPPFASPEQLLGNKKLMGYRSDFFSLGIISYYLYYGVLPFGNDIEKLKDDISAGNIIYSTDETCKLNKFFAGTLCLDPSMRPRNSVLLLNLLS